MKRFAVAVTLEAERDLDDIVSYIAEHDSMERALFVGSRIEEAVAGLSSFPERGAHPKELLDHGIRDFREVFFKPYRLIYRVLPDTVVVVVIADGRRDMRSLLTRRLLNA